VKNLTPEGGRKGNSFAVEPSKRFPANDIQGKKEKDKKNETWIAVKRKNVLEKEGGRVDAFSLRGKR